MDTVAAKKLVQETLQRPFDKELFVYLLKNILNRFDEEKAFHSRGQIKEKFKNTIKTYERLGTYKDSKDRKTDLLIVYLQKANSIERARSSLRNFVADYLKQRDMKDAALAAFVAPDSADWRFSFVKMEYTFNESNSVEEKFTPARRYSFLVGENENSHTAQSRLLPMLLNDEVNPTLDKLEEAFGIERVTKEFFEKYRDLFLRIKESLDDIVQYDLKIKSNFTEKNITNSDFAKKLLGQIVFLYFLQKKGWFGVKRGKEWGSGSRHFLRELFKKQHGGYVNFFNDILEPLFYEALRWEHSEDYYSRFDCRIPFLNGGLFDPINSYDWINTEVLIPNELFSNRRLTKEEDIGDGILDVFDRYNFTVKEDEPLEKEVAVDPEMLGKVFENLLPVKDRKSKGTYYTPREIVHYMCQQSLINYLYNELNPETVSYEKLGDPQMGMLGNQTNKEQLDMTREHRPEPRVNKEDIETLIQYGESMVEHDSRVVSGIHETRTYSFKLSEIMRKHAKLIDESLASIRVCDPAVGSGAFIVGMMNEIVKVRNALTPYIGENGERSPYHFKRQAIQNCLYGVDINPGAAEIAKLRLWLSLVVDEEERRTIQPLPNLNYKIVQGNSLFSVEKDLFNRDLFGKLEELKPLHFNETNAQKKQKYEEEINELISKITNGHKDFDFEVYFSEVFHEKKGFDLVIANPPYLSHDKIPNKKIIEKNFKAYATFADLYCYFLEIALNIQNPSGLLCYITSNSYLKAEYGKPLRDLLLEENHITFIINIEDFQVFDSAIVNTAVLLTGRPQRRSEAQSLIVNAKYTGKDSFETFIEKQKFFYSQDDFHSTSWYLLSPVQLALKKKVEIAGITLEKLGTKIRLGIATGANNAFVINGARRKELIEADPHSDQIIKMVLRGRDIFRYKYQHHDQYIILAANGINIRKKYPAIYKYLDSFGEAFKKRGAQGGYWFNLRPTAFLGDFKRTKIIWIELTDRGRFALSHEEIYLLNSAYFLIPPEQLNTKYLLTILNSKVIQCYLGLIAETSGMGVTRWINNYVKDFPIPIAEVGEQNKCADFVDKILTITNSSDYLEDPTKQAKVSEYERQIDQLVYKLYGLTTEEIKIVEEESSK